MSDALIESTLREVISRWNPEGEILAIEAITPDASLRRYYRMRLRNCVCDTLVAMVFDSIACPEYDVGIKVPTDIAVLALSRFFAKHGVSVPKVYYDARDAAVLLIEDLGGHLLIDVVIRDEKKGVTPKRAVIEYYREAIDQIVLLQSIPPVKDLFAFQRSFGAKPYYDEMLEFRDYLLESASMPPSDLKLVEAVFRRLSEQLDAFDKVLVHRDFHSWNLIVDSKDTLRVIDFQDALLATRCYDLVALLNDRDIDSALGPEVYRELLRYFYEQSNCPDGFYREYDYVLLQRDLKVAGRFAKLSNVRNLKQYEAWIPGTLRRIGSTLVRFSEHSSSEALYKDFLDLLSVSLEELRVGAQNSVRFDT